MLALVAHPSSPLTVWGGLWRVRAADLSNVEYMPAYLNKRLNNRLWTRRKVQQQYQQPSTFIICQATHRAPARGQLTSDHESGVE